MTGRRHKAKKLLSKKDYTPSMGFEKRRRMAAILSLVFIAAVFIIVIATSL